MCLLHFRFGDIISKIKQFMDRAQRSSIWESFNAKPLARLVVSHIGAVCLLFETFERVSEETQARARVKTRLTQRHHNVDIKKHIEIVDLCRWLECLFL